MESGRLSLVTRSSAMAERWTKALDRPGSLAAALSGIGDGATVALGGASLQRKPIAAVRALIDLRPAQLRVISVLGSLDVELLIAAGVVAELHSAGVGLDGAGLAPRYRAARERGSVKFVEWSEGTLLCALEAQARGVPSLPTWMALGSDLPALNDNLRQVSDPFTGEPVIQVRALHLDAAIIHVSGVDVHGNAYVDGDIAFDGALARAADRTIVTYESLRPAQPELASISRLWIDTVVPAPSGAAPTGCHALYRADHEVISRWASAGAEADPALLAAGSGA